MVIELFFPSHSVANESSEHLSMLNCQHLPWEEKKKKNGFRLIFFLNQKNAAVWESRKKAQLTVCLLAGLHALRCVALVHL